MNFTESAINAVNENMVLSDSPNHNRLSLSEWMNPCSNIPITIGRLAFIRAGTIDLQADPVIQVVVVNEVIGHFQNNPYATYIDQECLDKRI